MADGGDATGTSWWSTMPGVLTALAGIITAVAGLIAILTQSGLIDANRNAAAKPVAATTSGGREGEGTRATPTAAPVAEPSAARPAARSMASPGTSRSPAEVVAGLRAEGFKGLAVTAKDGSVIALAPGATIYGAALPLDNGQRVEFDRLVSVEINQPWTGQVSLNLTNGKQLVSSVYNYSLSGSNELGAYLGSLSELRRIDFLR